MLTNRASSQTVLVACNDGFFFIDTEISIAIITDLSSSVWHLAEKSGSISTELSYFHASKCMFQESQPCFLIEDTHIFDAVQEPDFDWGGVNDGFLSGETLQDKPQ